jgi:hypothetical protein
VWCLWVRQSGYRLIILADQTLVYPLGSFNTAVTLTIHLAILTIEHKYGVRSYIRGDNWVEGDYGTISAESCTRFGAAQ